MNLNKAVNFEVEALWRYQRRIMPLQYHVSKDEVELMEEFPDTIHQDDLFRGYMDWHSLRLMRHELTMSLMWQSRILYI